MAEIIYINQQLIRQIIDLINQLDEKAYKMPLSIFKGSSLGDHFRHILNFYQTLLEQQEEAFLDPAKRNRNVHLSTIPTFTIEAFEQIYATIPELNLDKVIRVLTESQQETAALTSTLGRELLYAYDHAIHHLAIIRIGLSINFPTVKIDQNLGVAPSTVQFQRQQKCKDYV